MTQERSAITVTGPVPASELGSVSMHEHVLVSSDAYAAPLEDRQARRQSLDVLTMGNYGLVRRDFNFCPDNFHLDDPDLVVEELSDLRVVGGSTVVDVSVAGIRGDVAALPDIARRSGVNIVLGTGLYIPPSRPESFRGMGADALAAWMVSELEQGIEDTGVRAGHIGEIGITELDEDDRELLRAAAFASSETGATISIHPGFVPGKDGRAIADVLEEAGARPQQVIMGHGDAFIVEHQLGAFVADPNMPFVSLDYHREVLQRGYTISIDCFGHDYHMEHIDWFMETDWQRLAAVVNLVREGYASQLVLSCDIFMRLLLKRGGGVGYARLYEWVLPALRRHGVSDEDIHRMTVENPARLLAVF